MAKHDFDKKYRPERKYVILEKVTGRTATVTASSLSKAAQKARKLMGSLPSVTEFTEIK